MSYLYIKMSLLFLYYILYSCFYIYMYFLITIPLFIIFKILYTRKRKRKQIFFFGRVIKYYVLCNFNIMFSPVSWARSNGRAFKNIFIIHPRFKLPFQLVRRSFVRHAKTYENINFSFISTQLLHAYKSHTYTNK